MRSKIKGAFQKASDFLKTKRFLSGKFLLMFFAVAIVVTIGASIPEYSANAKVGAYVGNAIDFVTSLKDSVEALKSANDGDWLKSIIYSVITTVLGLALYVVALLVYFGAWLVDIMLEPSLYVGDPSYINPETGLLDPIPGVLNSQTVETGWRTVRDMCNTFFIFFLLLIAFSMILRVQKFGSTKTLLVKFIMAIFLINFSMVIAKIIIDVGQVFMYEIISWMPGGFSDKAGSLTTIVEGFKNALEEGQNYAFQDVVKALFAVIYTVMLGLIYIMLAGFLLVRLIMFVILIILSPFAFLSIVLPSMSRHTNKWFTELVNQSLFGPVFLFFIYLSATMANELVDKPFVNTPPKDANIAEISEIAIIIIPNLIALCMLYMVIPVSKELSAIGSSRLIGGAMGMGKIMIGTAAGIKIAGGLGKKVGGTPLKTAHTLAKQRHEGYKNLTEKVSAGAKKIPGFGKILIVSESKKAQKREEKVSNVEKIMKSRKSSDRKTMIDQTIGPEAKADNIEAFFKLAKEENGKGLSKKELIKANFTKDKKDNEGNIVKDEKGNAVKELDQAKVDQYINKMKASNRDAGEIEKYMPNTIKDEKKRYEKFDEMIERNEIDKAKPEHFAKGDEGYLRGKMGDKDFEDAFYKKKNQSEKDAYIKEKEKELATKVNDDGTAKGGMEKAVDKLRTDIVRLASTNAKLDKIKKIEVKDGEIEFTGTLDHGIAKGAIEKMTPTELGRQNKDFHVNFAYHYNDKQVSGVYKDRDSSAEVKTAMESSITERLKKISKDGKSHEAEKGKEEEFEKLVVNLSRMGSKITRPTRKDRNKDDEDKNKDNYDPSYG